MKVALLAAAVAYSLASPNPAPTSVNWEYLRSLLPLPPQSGWTEAPVGSTGNHFDGRVTLATARAYYKSRGQTDAWIEKALAPMTHNGFVGGYRREWYRSDTTDQFGEEVDVFADASGVASAFLDVQALQKDDPAYQSSFDPQLGQPGYGELASLEGFQLVGVAFGKGNAGYLVFMSAERALAPEDVLPQARALAAAAPASIPVLGSGSVAVQSGRVSMTTVLAIAGVVMAALVLLLVIVGGAALFLGMRQPNRERLVTTTDGRFWWDGTSWQDTTLVPPESRKVGR